MASGSITKRSVDAIHPTSRDEFLWDTTIRGFGLKITAKGAKSYILQYRIGGRSSRTQRYTIGKHGSPWTPDAARKEAIRLLEGIRRGEDPQEVNRERQRIAVELAFDSYLERFLEIYGKRLWGVRTYASAASNLRRHVQPVLGRKPLPDIRRSDIAAVLDALPADRPALPRNVFAHTRKLFSWAVERGHLDRSPFEGLKSPPAVPSRERVLSDQELQLVWQASHKLNPPFGTMVRLLSRLGQRRDEVARMDWRELDRNSAMWTIPGSRTKNGETQIVPLGAGDIEELDIILGIHNQTDHERQWPANGPVLSTNGKTAISGFSKMKKQLDQEISEIVLSEASPLGREAHSMEPWRLHDLRRTLATGFQRLGIRFEVTEAVLNHVSGSRSGVAGIYQRHNWKEERRAALEAWAAHIADLTASQPSLVEQQAKDRWASQ